ncbi:hypothetical protein HU200_060151 [Digitaria exilis]|uniref:PGG domain-containing protein n=1 Tax=Digitaria exilis TaxID=1010633 RepID=A0A835E2K4_9POAL|nr:hypothetical protein HU200_060151 [Digitaria exilis]
MDKFSGHGAPRRLDGEEAQEAAALCDLRGLTYQAGLTPPSGLWPEDGDGGRRAGDPILLHNYPRRYVALFYCNTVSFISSVAVVVLLVNPSLYRPAMRSYALSVCTLPAPHDNRRGWYNAFFYCNSTSFVASVIVIVLLLLEEPDNNPESSLTKAINMTIMLDLLGLLVAYAAGSGRDWAAIGSVVAIAAAVLGSYIAVYAALSSLRRHGRHNEDNHEAEHQVVPDPVRAWTSSDVP